MSDKKGRGLFDEQFRLSKVSKRGDVVNWGVFRSTPDSAFPVYNPSA